MKVVLQSTYKYLPKGATSPVWKEPGEEVEVTNDEFERMVKKGHHDGTTVVTQRAAKGTGK